MSRKGKMPIPVAKGVEVKIEKNSVSVKGPKGVLQQKFPNGVKVTQEGDELFVSMVDGTEDSDRLHGLYRALIENVVIGCGNGFEKILKLIGVGYRAAVKDRQVDLQIGNSHPTLLDIPEGVEVKVEKNTRVIISGANKQQVGQFAASLRAKKPPEPYQGKGIRYEDEYVRRKAGKAAAK